MLVDHNKCDLTNFKVYGKSVLDSKIIFCFGTVTRVLTIRVDFADIFARMSPKSLSRERIDTIPSEIFIIKKI